MRIDHRERGADRYRSVKGIAAALQNTRSGGRGQIMGTDHHRFRTDYRPYCHDSQLHSHVNQVSAI